MHAATMIFSLHARRTIWRLVLTLWKLTPSMELLYHSLIMALNIWYVYHCKNGRFVLVTSVAVSVNWL